MATNNMKLIKEAIQETTETYVDQYMKNATFVKTEIGVVVGKGSHKGNKITIKQDKMGIQKNPIYDDIMSVGNIIFDDGTTGICAKDAAKKTGRHIDIDGLLKQIGGND